MKIPPGMTFNIGRRQYGEGEELPANAPESVKKKCAEHAAGLARQAKENEKPAASQQQQEGDK